MNQPAAFKARYIFPGIGTPLSGGVVAIHDGRIEGVYAANRAPRAHDLGDVAILPGLVNAHTHLEFSDLDAPLANPTNSFVDWVAAVVGWRRRRAEQHGEHEAPAQRAIERGVKESLAGGVAALGDIATSSWPDLGEQDAHPKAVIFRELIGLAPDRCDSLIELARSHLETTPLGGISPHAPYTVSLQLLEAACQLSAKTKAPLAMHLAESWEEIELMESGSGPLVELLRSWDVWHPAGAPRGIQPYDYLERLQAAHQALVIHGNFLDQRCWSMLAERSDSMSVVYCPRTHHYFQHGDYPLAAMLEAGVNVALGTDSRASNPDLSLFEEARFVSHHHPAVSGERLLQMATISGARALSLDHEIGSIEKGKLAKLTVVQIPSRQADDPFDLLFDDGAQASPAIELLVDQCNEAV